MYKDLITYELAEGVSIEHLTSVAQKIVEEWMSKQSGFIKWEIHKNKNGSFTDLVFWESEEDAKNSEEQMAHIPNAGEWYGCYKEGSISSQGLHQIGSYK